MNGNVIRTITIRGQAEGLDTLTAEVNKLAAAQENVAIVSEQSAKRILSLEDAWKRQTMRLDEAARAQANIARETKVADAALREGLATQAQHAQRLELINQRYTKTADATKVVTHQTGLARHELVNLGRQAQDVGVSLMSGQSPFTVLVQQGTQIADVFATSGGTLRGFFSQAGTWAKTFLMSTTGIVTSVLAVGAALVYAAVKWSDSGKTVEENLKEQERLYKEIKTQIDGKASAEAKAAAQSLGLSRYQDLQNEKRLRDDLNKSMETTIELTRRLTTTPTQVGGEMGVAPTGEAAAPGFEHLTAAREKLTAAFAAGQPGLTEFRDELAEVGMMHPELRKTIDELLKFGEAGAEIEKSNLKMQAMRAHLLGIATDAQMAAAGLGSVAEVTLNATMATQTADAAKRQAEATLQIAAAYPGMSIEVAKQLAAGNDQLRVAEARTGAEKMAAQELATQNQLLAQGKTLEEAIVLAAQQRATAEANVNNQIDDQIKSLERAAQLSRAAERGTTAQVKGQHAYADAVDAGADRFKAAALERATVADETRREDEQYAQEARSRIAAEEAQSIAASEAIASAHASSIQSQIAGLNALGQANARVYEEYAKLVEQIGFSTAMGVDLVTSGSVLSLETWKFGNVEPFTKAGGKLTQFNPAGYTSVDALRSIAAPDTLQQTIDKYLGEGGTLQGAVTKALAGGAEGLPLAQQIAGMLPQEQQAGAIQQIIDQVSRSPRTLANEMLLKQLNDQLKSLASSTDALNSTMQNALSPYYSQDPRTTKLGFRAGVKGNPDWMVAGADNANPLNAILGVGATAPGMAGGGSFIVGGGYSSVDNKIAQFPVASGEQVIVNRRPGGAQPTVVHNDNRIIIQGSVDQDTLSRMKVSRYQQAQRMRSAMSAG